MSVSRIASTVHSCLHSASLLAAVALTPILTAPASAGDYDTAIKDIQSTMGGVPGFVKQFPKAGLPGAWAEVKAIELSDKTALSPKVKSLISLAVAAQIPCNYCVWSDTANAKRAGATEQEIQEAVAMAALTRHWSTIFNGMQVDFDQFKKDMGGE
ncbi:MULTISPECIES: carboxymuconolactone decarboxylase family protein [unclassified Mesorhizobium]|uniref:carboxymuconolactone decarboxylase family protein n=1 Tax=unclassified Mesorhizobium TaxID=325217 RepID=UPI000BAFD5A0|nr:MULTISPECIES: carboxymuconolactone decarboxylase family protein [unclassified Mesorhizobium]TGT61180.1 carboxymuconolactone decarboxylase family protein [Mesorhizobium sp. M00.F.Ca.ET.170.01.1.1]AZO08946.1 carboxymuconolactone decarboxylase family protein [Mesorhizobium sp. M3A.F.Ca.ET.080.04.2.1]PBB84188.1 alkylhydroperoxidase [Mesorhizobium sp. WSM3876]RWB68174.1 MAG: carboxymuconolactone decarboxylase family protein [Mesorhizobium sp.]RWB84583.1 MAG: carboxymuconolactone decarboxylase fa